MKNIFTLLLCVLGVTACGQVTFNGNGNTGFGGAVGGSSMSFLKAAKTKMSTTTLGGIDINVFNLKNTYA